MRKTLDLGLKNFDCIPFSLQSPPWSGHPSEKINVSIRDLFHHLYNDTYHEGSANTSPAFDLYAPMLTAQEDFRWRNRGVASHTEAKIGEHNKLGKAFCRMFLHDHCGITYFVHMEDMLDKGIKDNSGYRFERKDEAILAPDYLCGSTSDFYLAEAKGTHSAISFDNKKFGEWRKQIGNVNIFDADDDFRATKGYIVATRMVSEENSQGVRSKLLAEDPWTDGKQSSRNSRYVGSVLETVIAGHYAPILDNLRQPLLATALRSAIVLPKDVQVNIGIWECLIPPLNRFRFVGGFIDLPDVASQIGYIFRGLFSQSNQFFFPQVNLSLGAATFFGLEYNTFSALRQITLEGRTVASRVEEVRVEETIPAPLSFLRDGSVIAPLDYFRLVSLAQV